MKTREKESILIEAEKYWCHDNDLWGNQFFVCHNDNKKKLLAENWTCFEDDWHYSLDDDWCEDAKQYRDIPEMKEKHDQEFLATNFREFLENNFSMDDDDDIDDLISEINKYLGFDDIYDKWVNSLKISNFSS